MRGKQSVIISDYKEIWSYFKLNWLAVAKTKLLINDEVNENLKPLFYYFGGNKEFFDCANLSKEFNDPSFDKGLLLVGDYGLGKSQIMRVLSATLEATNHEFKCFNCPDLVAEFEGFASDRDSNQRNKSIFLKKHSKSHVDSVFDGKPFPLKPKFYDDVKSEDIASNYGKINIMERIFLGRYESGSKTHASMNYRDGKAGNLGDALSEIREIYGGRVYDRFFSMFNIIELKGNSFRS